MVYGLGDTGATVAARLLGDANVFIMTNEVTLPGLRRIWLIPPDTALNPAYFAFTLNGGFGNFPWGFNVEPDVPL